jgi:hypothetical protein
MIKELEERLDRLEQRMPRFVAVAVRFTRHPSPYVRVPLGVGLVAGGVFSFLPVLGIWMLPLGMVVLARDVPPLRHPTNRLLAWIERRWPGKDVVAIKSDRPSSSQSS